MEEGHKKKSSLERKIRGAIQREYPGLKKDDIDEAFTHVRNGNNDTLTGLNTRRLILLMKPFFHIRDKRRIEMAKKEKDDESKRKSTCPFCFRIFIEKFSKDRHILKMHNDKEKGLNDDQKDIGERESLKQKDSSQSNKLETAGIGGVFISSFKLLPLPLQQLVSYSMR